MTFIDDYKNRIKKRGTNRKEQYATISKEYYENYLLKSVNKETVVWKGEDKTVVLLINSQDDSKVTRFLLTAKGAGFSVGDYFKWVSQEEEPSSNWIILRKTNYATQGYEKFIVVKSNEKLSWIDSFGVLKNTPVFIKGSMESVISGGWTVSNNLTIPVPNKGALMISPKIELMNDQKILLGEEGWKVVDRDTVSNPGISYISLLESKVDLENDDVFNQIANIYNENKYIIDVGFSSGQLAIGDSLTVSPKLYIDGNLKPAQFILKPGYPSFTAVEGMTIQAEVVGEEEFIVCLQDNEEVEVKFILSLVSEVTETSEEYKIIGDNSIKWGRERGYTLMKITNGKGEEVNATFSLDDESLAEITSAEDSACIVKAKSGKVGEITLTADYESGQVEKVVSITSIWR